MSEENPTTTYPTYGDIEVIALNPMETEGLTLRECPEMMSGVGLRTALERCTRSIVAICTTRHHFALNAKSALFMAEFLNEKEISMVYADYAVEQEDGQQTMRILNDAERHVLRDSFDFGPLIVVRRDDALRAAEQMDYCRWGSIYALTLAMQRIGSIYHTGVPIGTVALVDNRDSGTRQFDYVSPSNIEYQAEMERLCTAHLRSIGALVDSEQRLPLVSTQRFARTASVIIPVKNRQTTIADAVASALSQETDFDYNVIVVDNHSTDCTTEILTDLAAQNPRLVHIVPEAEDLGIGGCWNRAVSDERCGRFAVQLDSDDLYSSPQTLQRIVDKFTEQPYTLVVGSYELVDFDLRQMPPGVIDHREWTDANGANNILRINGMGAPRAFATEWLRAHPMPNVSYGEDYAAVLEATRTQMVGRIFDVLYRCRRWGGNSDAGLSPEAESRHNAYKDKLRSVETEKRIALNNQYAE